MKSGQLVGGIAIGALVGIGIGYLIGVDSEKRKQWMKMLTEKVFSGTCPCEDEDLDELLDGEEVK